jgi:hypothetical protein
VRFFSILSKYKHAVWTCILKIVVLHSNVSQASSSSSFSNISIRKKFYNPFSTWLHSSLRASLINANEFICILIIKCPFSMTSIFPNKSSHSTSNISLFQLTHFLILNHFASFMAMSGKTNVSIWSIRLDRMSINGAESIEIKFKNLNYFIQIDKFQSDLEFSRRKCSLRWCDQILGEII